MKKNTSMAIFFISLLNVGHRTCFFLGYDLLQSSNLMFVFFKPFYVWTLMTHSSSCLVVLVSESQPHRTANI